MKKEYLLEIKQELSKDFQKRYDELYEIRKQYAEAYCKHHESPYLGNTAMILAEELFPLTPKMNEIKEQIELINTILKLDEDNTKAIDKYLKTYGEAGINMMDKLFKKEEPKIEISKVKNLLEERYNNNKKIYENLKNSYDSSDNKHKDLHSQILCCRDAVGYELQYLLNKLEELK